MTHTAVRKEFEELIDLYAPVGQAGTGFTFTEGPIWHPRDHYLLFSDMPADVRRRWDPRNGTREVMRPSNKCNGMTYDADLNLIVCEHATSSLVRERPDGRREVLASHYNGVELNSPNDVCVHSDGSIYFSDPWYGRMPVYGVERPRVLGFQGVYRVPPGGGPVQLLVERDVFDQPNGLCFSPDEKKLYVNEPHAVRGRPEIGPRAGLAGRHEVRFARQCLVHGTGRHLGLCPERRIARQSAHSRIAREPALGRAGFPDVVRVRNALRLHRAHQGDTAHGAVYACECGRRPTSSAPVQTSDGMRLDASRCALIIQDMQNDVVMDGGAFASSGSPAHCREQNAIANIRRLADACRARGVPVIHVWFLVEPGATGVTMNAPLFEGLYEAKAMVRGAWGSAPVPGLERQPGDHVVEKDRMSAWEGTRLETILKALRRDTVIVTGAWTNMSIEHTARTGADKGYFMIVPEDSCSTMNADWHNASINYALQNVSAVTRTDDLVSALTRAAAHG
jgi:gluconolactonase